MKPALSVKTHNELRQAMLNDLYDLLLAGRISGKEFNSMVISRILPPNELTGCYSCCRQNEK